MQCCATRSPTLSSMTGPQLPFIYLLQAVVHSLKFVRWPKVASIQETTGPLFEHLYSCSRGLGVTSLHVLSHY